MQIIVVNDIAKGISRAKEVLYNEVDSKTVLFLSGGKTPRRLYATLAEEKIIKPAAVGMIDERFGKPMHENSNELILRQTGFLSFLESEHVLFYSMLQEKKTRVEMSEIYDQQVRDLFFTFPKSIAILGIGIDGHIASIMPKRRDFINPLFLPERKYFYVSEMNDIKKYKERITMTFAGISLIDKIIVLVFGKEKHDAFQKALTQGSVEDIPARFFQEPDIAKKTLFITDQKI